MRKRLQTIGRLYRIGVYPIDTCLLCDGSAETHEHLFFNCTFSEQCLQKIKEWLVLRAITCNYDQILGWISKRSGGIKFRKQVLVAAIEAQSIKSDRKEIIHFGICM